MIAANAYFITGTAYAGKSTMVKLLAERHNGIACRENYHEELMDERLDPGEFPCLCYTRDLQDWHHFIRRTPDEYEAWVDGAAAECEKLELQILDRLTEQGKPVFVDTNISLETLAQMTDRQEKALANFRECLKRINSQERYDRFLHSGFPVILRDENRSIEQTLAMAEEVFGLR